MSFESPLPPPQSVGVRAKLGVSAAVLFHLTRNTRAPHFTPQHWLLCHMGLY